MFGAQDAKGRFYLQTRSNRRAASPKSAWTRGCKKGQQRSRFSWTRDAVLPHCLSCLAIWKVLPVCANRGYLVCSMTYYPFRILGLFVGLFGLTIFMGGLIMIGRGEWQQWQATNLRDTQSVDGQKKWETGHQLGACRARSLKGKVCWRRNRGIVDLTYLG